MNNLNSPKARALSANNQHNSGAERSITTPNYPDSFDSAETIARRVGKDKKTIFRWADKGYFPRYKLDSGGVLFDPNEVLAYVASCRVICMRQVSEATSKNAA